MFKKIIYLIQVLFLIGCGNGHIFDFPDASFDAVSRGFFPECDEENLLEDFYHCGACEQRCNPTNSDRCVDGECKCGMSNACTEGADCRIGRCITADYSGTPGCEFDDECDANSACIEGWCTFVECVPEVCDGLDNDCDGVVDGTTDAPLSSWCYSGPETNPLDINEPCRAGVRVCENGEWSECFGEIPPLPEVGTLACDGFDNDCDFCIDGTVIDGFCNQAIHTGFDVVFFIDKSGSMDSYNEATKLAIIEFSTAFNRPDFRWAIVTIPEARNRDVGLFQNFTDYSTFIGSLDALSMMTSADFGGDEPSWDGIRAAGTDSLGLDYISTNIRIFILFTDEQGQTYSVPPISESMMCDSLTHGEVFVVFNRSIYFEDFDGCATHLYELSSDYRTMAELLQDVIADPCLEQL